MRLELFSQRQESRVFLVPMSSVNLTSEPCAQIPRVDNMDRMREMTSPGKIDLPAGHRSADNISVMLMAFPHLFPPSSNQWRENADLRALKIFTSALDIWVKFTHMINRPVRRGALS